MFLSVSELQVHNLDFNLKIAPGALDLLDASLRQEGDLITTGVASWNPATREITVRGYLSVELSYACDRCLEPVRRTIHKEFDLHYLPEDLGPVEEEREIHEADALIAFYSGGGLDLDDLLRESVLLEIPMRRICEPACSEDPEKRLEVPRGTHESEWRDSRWDALKKLHAEGPDAPGTRATDSAKADG